MHILCKLGLKYCKDMWLDLSIVWSREEMLFKYVDIMYTRVEPHHCLSWFSPSIRWQADHSCTLFFPWMEVPAANEWTRCFTKPIVRSIHTVSSQEQIQRAIRSLAIMCLHVHQIIETKEQTMCANVVDSPPNEDPWSN
jgi:hypothetical protein